MEAKRWWIAGQDDKTWGPFEKARVAELAAGRRLRSDGLVCAEGDARWIPIDQVPELADVPWPPRPAPAGSEPASTASAGPAPAIPEPAPRAAEPPAAPEVRVRLNELEPIHGWTTVLLSIPTLGLWGAFAFYRTMRLYHRLAGASTQTAEILFWVFMGLTGFVVALVVASLGFAWPLLVPAVIVGAFLLRETLRLREQAILRLVPGAATSPARYPPVKSDDWHFGLWITGSVLSMTILGALVGIPILVVQTLAWIEDHNRLAAIARGAPSPGPAMGTL